jgi:Domain of unknown function (DUF4357)
MPKLISFFLIDGTPDGRVTCELSNWTGKAYKIPRNLFRHSMDRLDLYKAGVYFLFGRDEIEPEINIVYVGEAEEVYKRVTQHQDKDWWTEAVIFISKDENLNKAHVKFLEYAIYDAALTAKRYRLENANTPNRPAISEAEQAVMTEFFENLKVLAGTMGYKLFELLTKPNPKSADLYFISAARGAKARALVTTEGIVVKEGSEIATSCVPSTAPSTIALRDKLLEQAVIISDGQMLRFAKDYLFTSPSTAAAVVLGRTANGRIEWKDIAARSLKENEEQ